MERTKEEEVHAAYRSLNPTEKEGKAIPIEIDCRQSFKLFCSDHVHHFYSDLYATKRVDFTTSTTRVFPVGRKRSSRRG